MILRLLTFDMGVYMKLIAFLMALTVIVPAFADTRTRKNPCVFKWQYCWDENTDFKEATIYFRCDKNKIEYKPLSYEDYYESMSSVNKYLRENEKSISSTGENSGHRCLGGSAHYR